MADTSVPVRDANGVVDLIDNISVTTVAGAVKRQRIASVADDGTWAYHAGTSGTLTLTSGQRARSVACHCTTAGTLTIGGGDAIPIPANSQFSAQLDGITAGLVFVFTNTDSYFVDYLS